MWSLRAPHLFFAIQQSFLGTDLYEAFLKGVGAAAASMVLAGLAQRLHAGDTVQSAQLPGGAGAEFETAEALVIPTGRTGEYGFCP